MRPLRTVYGVDLHLHPAEGFGILGRRCGPVLGQRIAILEPLAAAAGTLRVTQRAAFAADYVDQDETEVWMDGITENRVAGRVAGDVPGVEFSDRRDLAAGQMHTLEGIGPDDKNQIGS